MVADVGGTGIDLLQVVGLLAAGVIAVPIFNDMCCPSGANGNSDPDCSSMCGNGIVEPGERCDGRCPKDCNDNNACTVDALEGSASACNARS